MTDEKAIEVIRQNCYVSNLLDLDKTVMINTALDMAVAALKRTLKSEWKIRTVYSGDQPFIKLISCEECNFSDGKFT